MAKSPILALLLVIATILGVPGQPGRRLNEYVQHFEPLSYHSRTRRSVDGDDRVHIDFASHGREFNLELRRDLSAFPDQLVIEDGAGRRLEHLESKAHQNVFEGRVLGEPDSHVFGAVRDGVFDGQIKTENDGIYYVERVQKYFPDLSNETFHSVIYHEHHLTDPYHHSRHAGHRAPGCGVSDSVQDWMNEVRHSGEKIDVVPPPKKEDPTPQVVVLDEDLQLGPQYKYSPEANDPNHIRSKRSLPNPNSKKSCSLYIQTDPLFWKHIKEQEQTDQKTEEEILSLIAQHVKAVNRIYSDTSFDGKYKHNGYQFEVQRIKIHNDSSCSNVREPTNSFCIPNVDVSNFLNLHSKSNHEEFCLAYVFTYRDFTGGTLGLAWVASATGASGGICETYKRYTENINGVHHTAKRSLNTGIITFVNYNARVPPKVSQLTLAHEIGHNFGSPHDYPADCRPGGKIGNYIMFASATSGDRYNNNKFSECSKANISAVLDAIADGRKPNCFTESNGAFCGNKIVEDGEDCDCGFDENECIEKCCYPRRSESLSEEDNKKFRCKRRPSAECSPSEGPCCNNDCKFVPRWNNVQCKAEDDCTAPAFCNGERAKCPEPSFKPDNVTECNEGTQVCQGGECKDSICLKYNLISCFLTSDTVKDKRQLCELACQQPGINGTCMSTKDLAAAGNIKGIDDGLSLRPGSPCDNFQGYCDVFLKCRKVDAEGPLARLKNLLFNQETLLTIAQWVTEFWWAVLLMGIAFVIFMAIFIRCFAIHTPSSNPNLPKNLHFTETLRRPVRSLQHKNMGRRRPATQSQDHALAPMATDNDDSQSNASLFPMQYRPAHGGQGAPPPYPGRGGPTHGYGEGRGHYNRARPTEAATPFPNNAAQAPRRNQGGGGGGTRSSSSNQANRGSRIETQPIR